MRQGFLFGLGLFVLTGGPAAEQNVKIEHQPAACAVAEKFPRFAARFAPSESVAVARVLFQGETKEWYAVAMKAEGAGFSGVLPKPKKSLKAFRYYIEVTDKALGTTRTAEYTTSVVGSAGECSGKIMAATLGSASVLLQGPAGLAALPAGFASSGVVMAGSAAGSSAGAAGATAAAGGGGGLSTGAVVGIVGGVGAAAAGVAVAKSKSDSGGDSSAAGYTVTFNSNSNQTGIGLVECGGTNGTFFSFQSVTPGANGSFDEIWGNPQLIRATGQMTATSFQATMTCLNGARSGTITATGSMAGGYNGTFEFGNSNGTVAVTRR